ncbi:hypothetical protein SK128_003240 [Halocaridina rubra]|uniref:Uncharacterized protein n=1 Tax=Halocaridina rubra TaxID=373956 RepID=A0AAN8XFW6_HALRR
MTLWARAVLTHYPECSSRMTCEGVSFLPSAVAPLLLLAPLRTDIMGKILASAEAGNCGSTYANCPLFLDAPNAKDIMIWL